MFKDKFKEELNTVNPTKELEAAVLNRIKKEKELLIPTGTKKTVQKRLISAVAAAVAVVIFAAVVLKLPIFSNNSDYINHPGSYPEETASNAGQDVSDNSPSDNSGQIVPSKDAPQSTTYDAVYKLYEELESLMASQAEHSGYVNSDSSSLGVNYKGPSSNSGNSGSSVSTAPVKNYTETNLQVEGVEEGDIVKTDGKYIYTFEGGFNEEVHIVKATEGKLNKVATINVEETPSNYLYDDDVLSMIKDLYIYDNTLVVIVSASRKSKSYQGRCTVAMLFDVSNHKAPKCIKEYVQTGVYESSRIIGNKLYVFSSGDVYSNEGTEKSWYIPQVGVDNKVLEFIDEKDLFVLDGEVNPEYFLVTSIDLNERNVIDKKSVIGGGDNLYMNNNSIYAFNTETNYYKDEGEYKPKTYIIKFGINNGEIIPLAKTSVKGSVNNQFSADESGGYFKIITTTRRYKRICKCGFRSTIGVESNDIYVFDKYLKIVGSVNGIAKDESVTSSRFVGEVGYFCTTPLNANTDPFFAVDFSNPKKPKILDSLEFPGVVDYLHPYGDNMMLGIGETENSNKVKLIMFDVSNPKKIKQLFTLDTNVPYGNLDFDRHDGHKQVNVLKDKNIICFPGGTKYNMFTFSKKKGFSPYKNSSFATQVNRWGETMDDYDSYEIRGIFIDDYLYVCNYNGVISYAPFKSGKKINGIKFE